MKNLTNFIKIKNTYNYRTFDYTPFVYFDTVKTGKNFPCGFGEREEYIIKGEIRTQFWANRQEYPYAKEAAVKNMLHHFYGEIIQELYKIRHASLSGE